MKAELVDRRGMLKEDLLQCHVVAYNQRRMRAEDPLEQWLRAYNRGRMLQEDRPPLSAPPTVADTDEDCGISSHRVSWAGRSGPTG